MRAVHQVDGAVVYDSAATPEGLNESAVEDAYVADMAALQAILDSPTVPTGTMTTAVLSNVARQLGAAAEDLARTQRHIYRYLHGDYSGVD